MNQLNERRGVEGFGGDHIDEVVRRVVVVGAVEAQCLEASEHFASLSVVQYLRVAEHDHSVQQLKYFRLRLVQSGDDCATLSHHDLLQTLDEGQSRGAIKARCGLRKVNNQRDVQVRKDERDY